VVVAVVSAAIGSAGAAGRRGRSAAGFRSLALRFGLGFAARAGLALRDAIFFFVAFLPRDVRDFAADFAAFRRFLAMRAPLGEWATYSSPTGPLIGKKLIN
jgi:hypothetical protein